MSNIATPRKLKKKNVQDRTAANEINIGYVLHRLQSLERVFEYYVTMNKDSKRFEKFLKQEQKKMKKEYEERKKMESEANEVVKNNEKV